MLRKRNNNLITCYIKFLFHATKQGTELTRPVAHDEDDVHYIMCNKYRHSDRGIMAE